MLLLLKNLWAAPWALLGLCCGGLSLATGGSVQRVGRVLEFHGGLLPRLLSHVPIVGGAAAMTLGHVVIGRTQAILDHCREHELVHVRQYERWGPLFIPANFACSIWLMLQRRDPYLENPFEREAYDHDA